MEIICFCEVFFCLGKNIKSTLQILKALKLQEFGQFHLYTCNEKDHMNPFVGLSSLEPLAVLRPLLGISAPQTVTRTVPAEVFTPGQTAPMAACRDCSSHKLSQRFTSRLVYVICSESVCWIFSWWKILPYLYRLQEKTGKQ